jgi:hypothetical protein
VSVGMSQSAKIGSPHNRFRKQTLCSVQLALALEDFAASLRRRVTICSTGVGTSIAWLADRRRDPTPINILDKARKAQRGKNR